MALEALVTALTCLSTTSMMMTEVPLSIIMKNSLESFHVKNSTESCPVAVLGGFMARVQHMTDDLQSLKTNLKELQHLIDDYRNQSPVTQLESRILPAPPSPSVVPNDTPRNCLDQKHGQVLIRIASDVDPFYVNCDQEVRSGGWIVIAHRFDGREEFHRDWHNYKSGFGSLNSEFFIGLDKLHRLTNSDYYELYIIMRNGKEEKFARYDHFSILSEAEKYRLDVLGAYRGDAGDSLRYHAGKKFTTYDQDNDDNGQNCARSHTGAWWFGRECFESNLFGTFKTKYGQEIGFFKGILWKLFVPGPKGSLSYVRMLIRPYQQT